MNWADERCLSTSLNYKRLCVIRFTFRSVINAHSRGSNTPRLITLIPMTYLAQHEHHRGKHLSANQPCQQNPSKEQRNLYTLISTDCYITTYDKTTKSDYSKL